jgi:Family of unknown function (DUF6236)
VVIDIVVSFELARARTLMILPGSENLRSAMPLIAPDGDGTYRHHGQLSKAAMTNVAIYHPSINVPTGEWLQLSLLYWERLLRVVPPDDSRAAPAKIAALEEADLVRKIDPSPGLDAVADAFLSVIRENPDELLRRYELSSGSAWKGHDFSGGDPGMTYVHAGKLTANLKAELVESRLAIWDPDGWIGTHPKLARIYMSYLADRIGRMSAATPVTDDPAAHLLASRWSADQLKESLLGPQQDGDTSALDQDATASLALISVKAIAPERSLSIQEILDLRARYGEELMRFRDLLLAIVADAGIESVTRPDALEMHLNDLYERRVAPHLAQLRRDLRLMSFNTVEAAINMQTALPPAAAFAAGQVGVLSPGLTTGAAAAVSVVNVRRGMTSARKDALAKNPTAFLWRIDRLRGQGALREALLAALGGRI